MNIVSAYNNATCKKSQLILTAEEFQYYYEKYKNEDKLIIKTFQDFTIIKYNKPNIDIEKEPFICFFRSIILKNDKIVCFSPQKSMNFNTFIENNDLNKCELSEIIEGTMINLFYDSDIEYETHEDLKHWMVCTRSNVGANCRFNLDENITFKDMFMDAANMISLYDTQLDKNLCYSFVLQHPKNQTVISCNAPKITLTHVYRIDNNSIFEVTNSIDLGIVFNPKIITERWHFTDYVQDTNEVQETTIDSVYNIKDWENLIDMCSGQELTHRFPGFMIKNKQGQRTKINNIAYKSAKALRGNMQKKQYQYLKLRNEHKLEEYLKIFPSDRAQFQKYQEDLYSWTGNLFNYYIDCFITRESKLKNAPYEFKPILYTLHSQYLKYLKPSNKKVNFAYIKEYVKQIPIPKLMFSLNYTRRIDNA